MRSDYDIFDSIVSHSKKKHKQKRPADHIKSAGRSILGESFTFHKTVTQLVIDTTRKGASANAPFAIVRADYSASCSFLLCATA